MIDHKSIIQKVIERNKKTFIQSSIDFNKVSKEEPVEVVLSTQERLALQRQVKLSEITLASLECVKRTTPYLLPLQQEDVVKAEKWLYKIGNKAILFTNSVGSGKALCLDTPMITPNGWIKMRDVSVGTKLISSNGEDCTVTAIYPQGKIDIYRMTFSDGTFVDCCENHLWEVEDINDRGVFNRGGRVKRRPQVLSTKQIMDKGLRVSANNRINFNIPIIKPVKFSKKDYFISPYLMGVLLGDGCITHYPSFSNPEEFIVERVKKSLAGDFIVNNKHGKDIDYVITTKAGQKNPLLDELRRLNLMGCKSNLKFIPNEYLLGSIEQRIDLLHGLMDTDGYVGNKGYSIYFYTVSEKLRDGVRELIESLGGVVSVSVKKSPKFTHNGEVRFGQDCFILHVKMPPEINPFSLPRKRDKVKPKTKYIPIRYIHNIEYIGKKEAQCITVDSHDRLFAVKNYILTHNTFSAGGIIFRHYGDILIVVPSNQKCLDWKEELKFLGLKVNVLESIQDKGKKGINITTYANFRQNTSIQQRGWKMVFYDECHYIMSNEQGKETECLQAHRKTTNHHTLIREKSEVNVCGEKPTRERDMPQYNSILNLKNREINEEINRLKDMTKVVFLSATPFPYIENLEYADGYLFDIGSDKRYEDLPSERDMFFMDNFGYRFEKGKLIKPETGVDINKLEREFADKLLSSGAMSTRTIELNMDYSREFILV